MKMKPVYIKTSVPVDISATLPSIVFAAQALAAFAGITAEESANAIALLRGENDDSFYSFERKEAQIDGHILQRTSTPLLAVYDFSVSYPSVQGEE